MSNKALGRWVSTQRAVYKQFQKTGVTAHPEEMKRRINRLDRIGFSWSVLPGNTDPEEIVVNTLSLSSHSKNTSTTTNNDGMEFDDKKTKFVTKYNPRKSVFESYWTRVRRRKNGWYCHLRVDWYDGAKSSLSLIIILKKFVL